MQQERSCLAERTPFGMRGQGVAERVKQKYRKGSGKMPKIKSDYFKILARGSPTLKKRRTGSSSFSVLYKSVPSPWAAEGQVHRLCWGKQSRRDFHTSHPPPHQASFVPLCYPNCLRPSLLGQRENETCSFTRQLGCDQGLS